MQSGFYLIYDLGGAVGNGGAPSPPGETLQFRQSIISFSEALSRFPEGTIIKKATATVAFDGLEIQSATSRYMQTGKDFYGDPMFGEVVETFNDSTESGNLSLAVITYTPHSPPQYVPYYKFWTGGPLDGEFYVAEDYRLGKTKELGNFNIGSFKLTDPVKEDVDITEVLRICLANRKISDSYVGVVMALPEFSLEGNLPSMYESYSPAGMPGIVTLGPKRNLVLTANSLSIYNIRVEYEFPREFFLGNIFYGNMPSLRK
jgi:hypothetical protein